MATPRILGLPFRPGVDAQVKIRQKRLSQINKSPEDLVVFNSATSFVRLSSAVSVDGTERQKTLETNLGLSTNDISGYNLAKNMVLWGGVNIQNLPGGIGYGLNSAYGFLSDSGQGLKPMPGITSMTSTYKNNGSLREVTLQIKCFTRKQFEAIEAVYLRLGYTMVVEWGHTDYFDNDETRESITQYSVISKLFTNPKITADEILQQIETNKRNTSFNYDGLLSRVTNFNWTLNSDLSYDITLYLVSWGDIIDSLKINTNNKATSPTTLKVANDEENKIKENLINLENNKSLSTLNSFFYDVFQVVVNQNIESFGNDVQIALDAIRVQNEKAPIYENFKNESISFLNGLLTQVENYSGPTEVNLRYYGITKENDQDTVNKFKQAVNAVKNQINNINTVPSAESFYGNILSTDIQLSKSSVEGLPTSKNIDLYDFLKDKIDNEYNGPSYNTPFEFYLTSLSNPYSIDLVIR